jgi:hypothetical protein
MGALIESAPLAAVLQYHVLVVGERSGWELKRAFRFIPALWRINERHSTSGLNIL